MERSVIAPLRGCCERQQPSPTGSRRQGSGSSSHKSMYSRLHIFLRMRGGTADHPGIEASGRTGSFGDGRGCRCDVDTDASPVLKVVKSGRKTAAQSTSRNQRCEGDRCHAWQRSGQPCEGKADSHNAARKGYCLPLPSAWETGKGRGPSRCAISPNYPTRMEDLPG